MVRVCLAGPIVTGDEALVEALTHSHQVRLVWDIVALEDSLALRDSDVLVLDAGGIRPTLHRLIQQLRLHWPDLPIVLVDGELTEDDKADAFRLGVLDYFAAPCHVELLAERLEVLARGRTPSRLM